MGLPALVTEALTEVGEDAAERVLWEKFLASVEDIASRARRWKEHYDLIREGLARFEAGIKGRGDSEAVETAIEDLLRYEQRLKKVYEPTIRRVKAINKSLFSSSSMSPGERARVITVADRYSKVLTETIELLRDTRWRLMVKRAEFEDSGDAPVFNDPETLLLYLDAQSQPR